MSMTVEDEWYGSTELPFLCYTITINFKPYTLLVRLDNIFKKCPRRGAITVANNYGIY